MQSHFGGLIFWGMCILFVNKYSKSSQRLRTQVSHFLSKCSKHQSCCWSHVDAHRCYITVADCYGDSVACRCTQCETMSRFLKKLMWIWGISQQQSGFQWGLGKNNMPRWPFQITYKHLQQPKSTALFQAKPEVLTESKSTIGHYFLWQNQLYRKVSQHHFSTWLASTDVTWGYSAGSGPYHSRVLGAWYCRKKKTAPGTQPWPRADVQVRDSLHRGRLTSYLQTYIWIWDQAAWKRVPLRRNSQGMYCAISVQTSAVLKWQTVLVEIVMQPFLGTFGVSRKWQGYLYTCVLSHHIFMEVQGQYLFVA